MSHSRWQKLRLILRDGVLLTPQRVRAYTIIALGAEILALAILAARIYGLFLTIDPPTSLDFISFYAAGSLADHGTPALVYDPAQHQLAEQHIYGDDRIPYFGFYYPPAYQLLCAVLALFPFTLSYLLFMAATGAAFLWMLRKTIPDGILLLALLSFPASFFTVALGQNSFLTAALFGGALLLLERRPILSGILFGALCYKPHFLMIVPVALLAGRYWWTFITTGLTALALFLLSGLLLGWEVWHDFIATTLLAQSVFESGRVGFWGLVSLFGAVRLVGGGTSAAYLLQTASILFAVIATAWVWYRRLSLPVRAMTLVGATLIALPVVLFYDLLLGTVAMAWLFRDSRLHGYLPWEKTLLCLMWPIALLCRGIGEQTNVPTGPWVTFGLLALALAHALREYENRRSLTA